MSQTLITDTDSSAALAQHPGATWISPSADLWVASRLDSEGVRFLGFVEQSLDGFVAVGGEGVGLGRHTTLTDAQSAVQSASPVLAASEAQSWSAVGAPVLSVRELRAR